MEPSNKHPNIINAGFTLVEVLIAITILSFISFSTYKMVDSNTDTKERVVKEDQVTIQGLTAIGRLDSDFSQIYNPLYFNSKLAPTTANLDSIYSDQNTSSNGSFDGKTQNGSLIPQFKSEEKSSIVFLTLANRRKIYNSKESRFAWVKYSLSPMEPDPENPDDNSSGLFNLTRQSIASDIYSSSLDWQKPKPQIVMDRIKELEFQFWDERSKKFTSSLNELNENKNLIRSIKISIKWIDQENNEQKIEKTFRTIFPLFNTKLDELAIKAAAGQSDQPGGLDNSAPSNTGGTIED